MRIYYAHLTRESPIDRYMQVKIELAFFCRIRHGSFVRKYLYTYIEYKRILLFIQDQYK